MRVVIGLAAGALLLAGTTTSFAQAPGASAELKTPSGEMVGTATLAPDSGGVHLRAQVRGLPPGEHGVHIHETGQCNPPDFMSAGNHFNPTTRQHGLNNPRGSHAGDMQNLTVGADGTGTYEVMLDDTSLTGGAGDLFKSGGTALVIHAGVDDQMTDPSGNSGGRLACGVISRAGTTAQSAPAAQPSPAAKPATAPAQGPAAKPAPAQAPAAKPAAAPSPAALPRTGSVPVPVDASLPAALAGLGAMAAGLTLWRRRR